jgi:flagellum-specific peptidoglycan hydrolase FlgJ/predicted chitinase
LIQKSKNVLKTLEQNSDQVIDLADQEKSGSGFTLTQYFGTAGSGAADSGPNNLYTQAGDSKVNSYKQLFSPNGPLFFDDVDHFRIHFLSNIDKYASPEINEKDKNRRAFFEFSAYMLYSAVNADEDQKEEKKKPVEAVLSIFKRREIVKFDAKRKRFLNKMIKTDDPWSSENLSALLSQYNWQEAFNAYQSLKEEHHKSNTENDYSKSSELFAREDRDDDDAIYYSKDDYKNESEWYYLGLRNQMTRREQFVQEQQLYGEFCLYLSLKQQLYKNSNTESLNELNENAQKFVDKMYGDGLNENFWGQAKYFRLLKKYFPDYADYLTEQRDIIKKGLNSVMDDLLTSIEAFVKRLNDFLAGVDDSESQLMQLSSELPAVKAKIASTKTSTAAILSEFGPEHKKTFESGLDALSGSMNVLESLIIEKQRSLNDHEVQKKEGLVVLQNLIEVVHQEKTALGASHLITDVEPFISVVARLYTKFHAAEDELRVGLKLHEEIDELDKEQREKIRETKEEAVGFDKKAIEIEKNERQRRLQEIADARAKFSQLTADGMKKSDKVYYLDYDGSPEKEYNESYWDALVERYTETPDDIQVVQYMYGDLKISKTVTNTFVDFLFGIIDAEKFDKLIEEYSKDRISSVYAVLDHIEKVGMAGISEKFSGDTKEIYETETPEYYIGVIKAKAHVLSKKPSISEKFTTWQSSVKRGIDRRNYHNVEYAKEKRRGQVISNWFSEYKSGTRHRDELACDITPYLESNEFDVRSGIASLPVAKQGDLIDAILDKIAEKEEDLSLIHGGLLLFFHDRLEASGVASEYASPLKKHLESSGWISSDDKMNHLRSGAMDRAMDFIDKNPNKSSKLYGFAGYHRGVPGKPVDCSGMVSQCVNYVGSDYLNSSPKIYGKQVYWLNGVGNIINQPNVWRILPEEVQPGDLITMSDRRNYHEIETGHIAFVYDVKRSSTGEITELVIRHSSGSKGPNVQTVDLTNPKDSYAKYFPSFRYWRFGDPDYQIPEENLSDNAQFKMGEYELESYSDESMPSTVDFKKGKKYVEDLNEEQKENLQIIVNGLRKGGINNNVDIAAILAICSKESNLIPKNEIMNYSKERLPEVWGEFSTTGKRVKKGEGKKYYNKKAEEYAGNPEKLANHVYGGRFDNTEPGDGWKYRGRGFNGITFKSGFTKAKEASGRDVVTEPDLLNEPVIAAEVLAAYMKKNMGVLKSEGSLELYNSQGIGDFKTLSDAVFAYYHCNTGPYKDVSTIKAKTKEKESGMARAQARAPYFLQLLTQLTTVDETCEEEINEVCEDDNTNNPFLPSFDWNWGTIQKPKGKEPKKKATPSQSQYVRPTGNAEFTLGVKYKPEEFKKTFGPIMMKETEGTSLFPSVKLAQMALETGWGEHTAGEGKNLFGIKATGEPNEYWNGDYVTKSTGEHYNGEDGVYKKKFRKYKTYEDCIKDHSRLLLTASHYKKAREATTPEEQAKAIHEGGYATSPTYANKLISIIDKYGFKDLDNGFGDPVKSENHSTLTLPEWNLNDWMKNVTAPDNPSDWLTEERFAPVVDQSRLNGFFSWFNESEFSNGASELEPDPEKLPEFDQVPSAFKKQYGLNGSVGEEGNKSADVKTVQKLMSMMGYSMSRSSELNLHRDGKKGALFMSTIFHFQSIHGLTADMTIAPDGETWEMMIRVAYSNAQRIGENVTLDDPENLEKVAKELWQDRRIDKKDIPEELVPNIDDPSKTKLALDTFGYMCPTAFHKRLAKVKKSLEHIDKAVKDNGGGGIEISCGYRSPEKNASLEPQGSAENSNHIIGEAADIFCKKWMAKTKKKHLIKFHNVIMDLMNDGTIEVGAIATYWDSNSPFIHYDIRGNYTNFKGENGSGDELTDYTG